MLNLERLEDRCVPATWTGANGSAFGQANNWVGGVPGSSDHAIFSGLTSNLDCTISSSSGVGTIQLKDGYSGTVTIEDGVTLTVNGASNLSSGTVELAGSTSTIKFRGTTNSYGTNYDSTGSDPGHIQVINDATLHFYIEGCTVQAHLEAGDATDQTGTIIWSSATGGLTLDSDSSIIIREDSYLKFTQDIVPIFQTTDLYAASGVYIHCYGTVEVSAWANYVIQPPIILDGGTGVLDVGALAQLTVSGWESETNNQSVYCGDGDVYLGEYSILATSSHGVGLESGCVFGAGNSSTLDMGSGLFDVGAGALVVRPGGEGTFSVVGDVDLSAGELRLSCNGSNYDYISVSGAVNLGGTLDMTTTGIMGNPTIYVVNALGGFFGNWGAFDWNGNTWSSYGFTGYNFYLTY